MIANTCKRFSDHPFLTCADQRAAAMDTDKVKIYGAKMKVESTGKLAELERAEKV